MSRRIEIELTSQRDDGTWTWRAAGAKQPKGVLDASALYEGCSVGDVVRADADFEIDGIFVTNVMPPKGRSGRPESERIELLGGAKFEAVTTQLAKGRRRDADEGRGSGGKGRGGGRGRDREDRSGGGGRRGERKNRGGENRKDRPDRPKRRPRAEEPERPRAKKLRPGRVHRKALIESLPEAQQLVAEQVSRGGIAAVRKEIETQNARAASDGTPQVPADALVALAEGLLPQIRGAEWRDRADAVLADIDELELKDIRTVVLAADDAARDPESREIAEQIRAGLNRRVDQAQTDWLNEIQSTLADGRVVRALRVSSRPPKAGAPLPADLSERLVSAANEALTGDISQQRIGVVLEAAAFSTVRPHVILETIPEKPSEELLESVNKVADRLPEIAAKFGVSAKPRGRGRGRGAGKGPRRPPRPPVPEAASESAATTETPSEPAEVAESAPSPDPQPSEAPAEKASADPEPTSQETPTSEEQVPPPEQP